MIEDVSKMDLSGFMIGEVRNNVDPDNEGKIAVFIPQLMYESQYNESPYEETVNVSLNRDVIVNSSDFEDFEMSLESSNYIWARPLSYYEDNDPNWKYEKKYYNSGTLRVPRIGSQILIIFFNSDLQKCYYLPFSPNVEKDKIDDFNCINSRNYNNPETRPNVDVIRFYWDGMRIEADTNTHELKLATPNGNYIKLSNENIEIRGNVHIIGGLEVDTSAKFKDNVDINGLVTCKNKIEVQGTGYFYSGTNISGSIMNNRKNLSTHTHMAYHGSTSGPN